jgi:catechol 2,3-dioxygenase-like lactoylglutathione lyase family enzyme
MSLESSEGGASPRRVSRRKFLSSGAQLAVATGALPLALEAAPAAMAATRGRPPGLVGCDHVGIMVPNIEEATAWFKDILGATDPLTFGPFSDPTGNLMTELVGVNPRAVIPTIKQLRIGHSANIELLEYRAPHQSHRPPKNSDFGGHHIAFYVRDIAKAVKYMESKPAKKLLGPFSLTSGPAAGQTINYFHVPFGTYVEFISYPHGMAYAKTARVPLWNPALNRPTRVQRA